MAGRLISRDQLTIARGCCATVPECHSVLGTELLQLGHHAVGDARNDLGIEAVHRGLDDLQLVLNGKVDKIGVQQDVVRRAQSAVVVEEHGGRHLRAVQRVYQRKHAVSPGQVSRDGTRPGRETSSWRNRRTCAAPPLPWPSFRPPFAGWPSCKHQRRHVTTAGDRLVSPASIGRPTVQTRWTRTVGHPWGSGAA